jgi:chorismate synthase
MASNSFGQIFRIKTFGESHGPCIGVVIDGCPAGLQISIEEIQIELDRRKPGQPLTTPRNETDAAEILSGLFEGKTTGAPITILIRNRDADSSQYDTLKNVYRPGHANFTYLEKYGHFDYRGGGRASARETAARVAAGAVAKKFLANYNIHCSASILEVGGYSNPHEIERAILSAQEEGDSLGGIIACTANIPPGLGDPVYNKLEAQLAAAMLSLPATKGFEIGSGFQAARMKGSEHNDSFELHNNTVRTTTNYSGGTLGGISTGSQLYFKVAFKPTSSIKKPQQTVTLNKESTTLELPKTARHDPCVALRAIPIVEAMTALVLADAILQNRCAKL